MLLVTILPSIPRAAPTALLSPVLPDGLGVNIHFTDARPGEMEMLAAGGFKWVRMDLIWEAIERERGVYDFAAYDRLMEALGKHGIRALFILDYGNRLYDDGLSPYTAKGREAFAKWAAASARHFAGKGVLWEMWNEPNITFWKPKPKVGDYIKLALATGRAIRKAARGETYIGPATSQLDMAFLEECFKAGLLEYWTAVSVHPYRPSAPETAEREYRALRRLIDKYAPKGKHVPILSGEWGYSAAWEGITEEEQGRMLCRQWLTNIACGIPLSIWYDWHDDGEDPKDGECHFGTVRFPYLEGRSPVYEPKPAYLAAKALTNRLAGYSFTKRLAVGSREDWVLLFTKDGEQRLAAWTASPKPRSVAIPASPGGFRAFSHLGEPLAALSAGPEGLTVTLSGEPLYLESEKADELLRNAVSRDDALEASVLPVSGGSVWIRVTGAGGKGFRGTLELTGLDGLRCDRPSAKLAVKGAGEATVGIGVAVTCATGYSAGCRVTDSAGREVLVVPPVLFIPLPELTTARWQVFPDGDEKIASALKLGPGLPASGPPLKGMKALRLDYRFAKGWKFARVASKGTQGIAGKPAALGLWIYGDGKGNLARLRFADSTGQTFQPGGFAIDWKGWRFETFPMDGSDSGHWGGADDGVVHYPIRWDSVFLVDSVRQEKTQGTVYIAGPTLIESR